jgi:hypothetical protein
MLVCSVSLRPVGRSVAATLAEAAAAADSPGTGNVVFATLVDDPASVGDLVDAYLGEIMLEAASAADVTDVVFVYSAAIDESVTASSTQDGTVTAALVAKQAMVAGPVFVNSDGTSREANAHGIMGNL